MTRNPSPMQVRIMASAAIRRARMSAAPSAPMVREPEEGETPLSAAELAFGISRGLIRRSAVQQSHAQ